MRFVTRNFLMEDVWQAIARAFRQESGCGIAGLISYLGDFELAEDVLQDAMLIAPERWPDSSVPRDPAAWLTTTARNKAIDRIRRRKTLTVKMETLQAAADVNLRRLVEDIWNRGAAHPFPE